MLLQMDYLLHFVYQNAEFFVDLDLKVMVRALSSFFSEFRGLFQFYRYFIFLQELSLLALCFHFCH